MSSSVLVIYLSALMVQTTMSWLANARLRHHERLPMQFLGEGAVGWSAPRPIALSFTPVLSMLVMWAGVEWVTMSAEQSVAAMWIMALSFIGCHAFHLWLISRWSQRQS